MTSDQRIGSLKSVTAIAGLLAVLLLGALLAAIAVAQHRVSGMAAEARDHAVKVLLERQRVALNLERLRSLGDLALAAGDARQRREAELAARTLAHHPGFAYWTDLRDAAQAAGEGVKRAVALLDQRDRALVEDPASDTATRLGTAAHSAWITVRRRLDGMSDRIAIEVSELTTSRFDQIEQAAGTAALTTAAGLGGAGLVVLALLGLARRFVVAPVLAAAAAIQRVQARLPAGPLPLPHFDEHAAINEAVRALATVRRLAEAPEKVDESAAPQR